MTEGPPGPLCEAEAEEEGIMDDLISAAGCRLRVGTGPCIIAFEPRRGGLDGAEKELLGG